jgi:hypothetical protein
MSTYVFVTRHFRDIPTELGESAPPPIRKSTIATRRRTTVVKQKSEFLLDCAPMLLQNRNTFSFLPHRCLV